MRTFALIVNKQPPQAQLGGLGFSPRGDNLLFIFTANFIFSETIQLQRFLFYLLKSFFHIVIFFRERGYKIESWQKF